MLLFPVLSKQDYNIIIALRGEIYHGGLKTTTWLVYWELLTVLLKSSEVEGKKSNFLHKSVKVSPELENFI